MRLDPQLSYNPLNIMQITVPKVSKCLISSQHFNNLSRLPVYFVSLILFCIIMYSYSAVNRAILFNY